MDKKRVLITGASGFIGKNCAKEFIKRGWKVVSLIHKKVPEEFKKFRKNNEMDLIYGDIESTCNHPVYWYPSLFRTKNRKVEA